MSRRAHWIHCIFLCFVLVASPAWSEDNNSILNRENLRSNAPQEGSAEKWSKNLINLLNQNYDSKAEVWKAGRDHYGYKFSEIEAGPFELKDHKPWNSNYWRYKWNRT